MFIYKRATFFVHSFWIKAEWRCTALRVIKFIYGSDTVWKEEANPHVITSLKYITLFDIQNLPTNQWGEFSFQ